MLDIDSLIISNIKEALEYLNQGEILYSTIDKHSIYFKKESEYIKIKDNNSSYSLSLPDFINLFKDNKFKIKTIKNEDLVDPLKDEEYYNFRHK